MSCIFFRTAGIADTLLLTGCQNIVVALTFSVIAYALSVFSTLFGRWQQ